MSNWQDMFERKQAGDASSAPTEEDADHIDAVPSPDPLEYRPWILRRGSGRPPLFIDLRRFEPKTGTLTGCQVSYPHLIAVNYWGDRMVSLDFGTRNFIIEGSGLGELPMWLQQGAVLAIQEHSTSIWGERHSGSIINRIIPVGSDEITRTPRS